MNVLDHGSIELVDQLGSDKTVVNAARVSYSSETQEMSAKDEKLIKYLAEHKHVSPFYHASMQFKVKAPISVRDEWYKHKIGTAENGVSSRYVEMPEEYYVPNTFRSQHLSNKQSSGAQIEGMVYIDDSKDGSPYTYKDVGYEQGYAQDVARKVYNDACETAFYSYRTLIHELGVSREQAREVLPLGTYTSWYWTASLMAVAHFIKLRSAEGAHFAIRDYAFAMHELARKAFPISISALLPHMYPAKIKNDGVILGGGLILPLE